MIKYLLPFALSFSSIGKVLNSQVVSIKNFYTLEKSEQLPTPDALFQKLDQNNLSVKEKMSRLKIDKNIGSLSFFSIIHGELKIDQIIAQKITAGFLVGKKKLNSKLALEANQLPNGNYIKLILDSPDDYKNSTKYFLRYAKKYNMKPKNFIIYKKFKFKEKLLPGLLLPVRNRKK